MADSDVASLTERIYADIDGTEEAYLEIAGPADRKITVKNIARANRWQYFAADHTAEPGDKIQFESTGSSKVLTLPPTPSVGDEVLVEDPALNWNLNPPTIARNGELLNGAAADYTANIAGLKLSCVFVGGAIGWAVR